MTFSCTVTDLSLCLYVRAILLRFVIRQIDFTFREPGTYDLRWLFLRLLPILLYTLLGWLIKRGLAASHLLRVVIVRHISQACNECRVALIEILLCFIGRNFSLTFLVSCTPLIDRHFSGLSTNPLFQIFAIIV